MRKPFSFLLLLKSIFDGKLVSIYICTRTFKCHGLESIPSVSERGKTFSLLKINKCDCTLPRNHLSNDHRFGYDSFARACLHRPYLPPWPWPASRMLRPPPSAGRPLPALPLVLFLAAALGRGPGAAPRPHRIRQGGDHGSKVRELELRWGIFGVGGRCI